MRILKSQHRKIWRLQKSLRQGFRFKEELPMLFMRPRPGTIRKYAKNMVYGECLEMRPQTGSTAKDRSLVGLNKVFDKNTKWSKLTDFWNSWKNFKKVVDIRWNQCYYLNCAGEHGRQKESWQLQWKSWRGIEVVITRRSWKPFVRKGAWVRIPSSPFTAYKAVIKFIDDRFWIGHIWRSTQAGRRGSPGKGVGR